MSALSANEPSADADEDVADFLRRIKELGDQREREDLERTRKLEEEIAEGRRLREARRQERARSLSPEKQSPATTPRPADFSQTNVQTLSRLGSSPAPQLTPHSKNSPQERSTRSTMLGSSTAGNVSSTNTSGLSSIATIPSRSGTLSWQQRPGTLNGTRSRPLSVFNERSTMPVSESVAPSPDPASEKNENSDPSRVEIAEALAMKDPAWFRQTSEVGRGSSALRRNREELGPKDNVDLHKRELHGLHRNVPNFGGIDSTAQVRAYSSMTKDDNSKDPYTDTNSALLKLKQDESRTPENPSSQLESATSRVPPEQAAERKSTRSVNSLPDRSVTSARERSVSPNKPMGGFVESAMLARNNSVSKRWSNPNGPGVAKQNSGIRQLGGHVNPQQDSTASSKLLHLGGNKQAAEPDPEKRASEGVSVNRSNHLHGHSRSGSIVKQDANTDSPLHSPSKRWSPVKSSWLESALTKPETSKTPAAAPPTQPSWMVQLNKARQERMSRDLGNGGNTKDIFPELPEKTATKPAMRSTREKSKTLDSLRPNDEARDQNAKISNLGDDALSQTSKPEDQRKISKPVAVSKPANLSTDHSAKSKPDTPPKKNISVGLNTKSTNDMVKNEEGLEFKAAFGKLRRTQTQKYIAPDELKDNILRGKAGLSITDGPQKYKHRDEFKESLVHQKEAMKAKAAELDVVPQQSHPHQEAALPEAIEKRRALGHIQSSEVGKASSSTNTKAQPKDTQYTDEPSSHSASTETNPPPTRPEPVSNTVLGSKLAERFNPGLAGLLARRPSPGIGASSSPDANNIPSPQPQETSPTKSTSEPSKANGELQHMTKGRARGPKRRLPKSQAASESSTRSSERQEPRNTFVAPLAQGTQRVAKDSPKPAQLSQDQVTSSPPDLRKLNGTKPNVSLSPATQVKLGSTPSSSALLKDSTKVLPQATSPNEIRSSSKPTVSSKPPLYSKPASLSGDNFSEISTSLKPLEASSAAAKTAITKMTAGKPEHASPTETKGQVGLPDRQARQIPLARSPVTSREAVAKWGMEQGSHSPMPAQKELVKAQTEEDEASADIRESRSRSVELAPAASKVSVVARKEAGLASQLSKPASPRQISDRPQQPRHTTDPQTSNLTPAIAPTLSSEPKRMVTDFFDSTPRDINKLGFDTSSLLGKNPFADKIKTIRKTIYQLSADGKTTPLTTEGEHILYSESMYVCTHVFGSITGSRITEVYLWTGKDVPGPVYEDAQVFARKIAKDAGGSLINFPQGKESANFFQALGGIIITRHGSSRASGTRPAILCGRKHLGHIAFDEVAFNTASFSAGFPFIVMPGARSNKLFLWKGAGCSAEELGSARLIIMDLSGSNSVVEVDDGAEPAEFLQLFPGSPGSSKPPVMPRNADHWKLKANRDDYRVRLFRIEHDASRPESSKGEGAFASWTQLVRRPNSDIGKSETKVMEITPFRQQDLEPEHIYVLDAFFELYIVVGALSQRQSQAFASALLFAQDYSMLSASTEDRPHVPFCTVVMEGVPRDMKRVFRQWDDDYVQTEVLARGLSRGRSLRVLPLSTALDAMRR